MKKTIYSFIILLFINCDIPKSKFYEYEKEDFYFIIQTESNDTFDSRTMSLRRLYIDDIIDFNVEITKNEIESVYKLSKELNIKSFPLDFESNKTNVLIGGPGPSLMLFCYGKERYRSSLDLEDIRLNVIKDDQKLRALQYKKIYDHILKILYSKREYMDLPESDMIYM